MLSKLAVLAVAASLAACATTVSTRDALFTDMQDAANEKECYSYDTFERSQARTAPTSIGLGIVGGLFPPLLLLTAIGAGAAGAADAAALPVKCGLTFDDAMKEAWTSSFNEQATAIWTQKRGSVTVTSRPLVQFGKCAVHETKAVRTLQGKAPMQFQQVQEICKDLEGVPQITASNVTQERINILRGALPCEPRKAGRAETFSC